MIEARLTKTRVLLCSSKPILFRDLHRERDRERRGERGRSIEKTLAAEEVLKRERVGGGTEEVWDGS